MCPILLNETLEGGFLVELISRNGDTILFEIREIDWWFVQGAQTVHVTGAGQYRIAAGQQQMTLALRIGDGPVQEFDSGLVPVERGYPEIAIAVALNGFFCYDYVFVLVAQPNAVENLDATWGSLKSSYR